jgi:hypothetical protein
MRHADLAISLFLVTTLISTVSWVASTPELALYFIPSTPAQSQDVASNDTSFIEQVRASLSDDIPEPPTKQRWIIQNASMSTGITRPPLKKQAGIENAVLRNDASKPPVRNNGLLVKAAYGGSYGVNEDFIKKACSDLVKRSP